MSLSKAFGTEELLHKKSAFTTSLEFIYSLQFNLPYFTEEA
jgi:hypothetical protein